MQTAVSVSAGTDHWQIKLAHPMQHISVQKLPPARSAYAGRHCQNTAEQDRKYMPETY